jgi:hypothetical protein
MGGDDSDTIFGNLPAPQSSSWDESKHPRGQPENKGRFRSYAGPITIGTKDPKDMTHSERAKEHLRLSRHSSALDQQMIDEGRGTEKPSERRKKTDPLSQAANAVDNRMQALKIAHEVYGNPWKHGQFLPTAPYERLDPKGALFT